jgi:uncharacterized membrane protein YciS (DUF1049 family)
MDSSKDPNQNRKFDPTQPNRTDPKVIPFRAIKPADPNRILSEEPIEPDAYLEMPHTPDSMTLKDELEWSELPVLERIFGRFKLVARDKGAFDLARNWSRQEMTLEDRTGFKGISGVIYFVIFLLNGVLLSRAFEDVTQGVRFDLIAPEATVQTSAAFVLAGVLGLMIEWILASILFVRVALRLDYEGRIQDLINLRKENHHLIIRKENISGQIDLARRNTTDERRQKMNPFDILWGTASVVGLSIDWLAVLKVLSQKADSEPAIDGAVTYIQWENCTAEHYIIASISVVIILMTSGLLGYFLYLPKAKNTVAQRFQDYVRSIRPFQLQSDIELNNRLHRRFLSDPKMQEIISQEAFDKQVIVFSQRHEIRFYRECIGRLQSNLYKQKVRVMSTDFKDEYERERILESLTIDCKLKIREYDHKVKELEFELRSAMGDQWPESDVPIFDSTKGDRLNERLHKKDFDGLSEVPQQSVG